MVANCSIPRPTETKLGCPVCTCGLVGRLMRLTDADRNTVYTLGHFLLGRIAPVDVMPEQRREHVST